MCGGCFVQQSFFYRPTEALISMCSKLRLFSRNSQRKSLSASWGLICPSLSFAKPLPIPLKALTLEPPPVASSIRNLIFLKDRLLAPEAEPLQIPYFLNLQSPNQPYQTLLAYPRYRSLQYAFEGYIHDIICNRLENNLIKIEAKAYRSQRKQQPPHTLTIQMGNTN